MQRNMTRQVSGALVLALLLAGSGEAAAPPPWADELPPPLAREMRERELRRTRAVLAGRFAEAQRLARQITDVRSRWQGPRHRLAVDARWEAERWQRLAALPEARQKQMVLAIERSAAGVRLRTQGKLAAAEKAHAEALALCRKSAGEEHAETALALDNLALDLDAQARHVRALAQHQQALAIRRKALGEQHPDTAASYDHLATCLADQGKAALAGPLYEKALAIRRKALGEHHPSTASSYNNTALSLIAQGKYARAQPLLEKALALFRNLLGERHPLTLTTSDNLATSLNAQGKYSQALPLLQKVLAIRARERNGEHPDAAMSYNNLAECLAGLGRHAQALPLHQKALAFRRKVLGEEHPQTAMSYNNVARMLTAQGKHAQAQPLYEKALQIKRKVLGDDHSSTALGYLNVALNLDAQGKHAQALPLHQKALAIFRKTLGDDHPSTITSSRALAANLEAQGKKEQTAALLEKALAIRRKVLGEEHPDTALGYANLADRLAEEGKLAEAVPLYRKALAIHKKVLGEEHPGTLAAATQLASALWQQGMQREAVHLLQASLPGHEAARFHGAAAGFDRALAARQASPHTLLAVGLARLGQPGNAFTQAEASLARGLLDDLARGEPADARTMAALSARLRTLDDRLVSLLRRSKLSDEQQRRREELTQQRRAVLSDLARLSATASPRQVQSLKEIQNHLPADAALVFWLDVAELGEHWGCVVRRKGPPAWRRLSGSGKSGAWTKEDSERPAHLVRALADPATSIADWGRLAAIVARQRLAPLAEALKAHDGLPAVRRLLVVPAGAMALVPVEVLGQDWTVSCVPSGSVFARLAERRRALGPTLLVVGDPASGDSLPDPPRDGVMLQRIEPGGNAARAGLRAGDVLLAIGKKRLESIDSLDEALEGTPAAVVYWRDGKEHTTRLGAGKLGAIVDERSARAAVRAWRRSAGGKSGPRPGRRLEVQAISRLVPGSTTLLGSAASEQELDRLAGEGKLKRFRLLHLATPAEIDLDRPWQSALLLARDRLPDPRDRVKEGRKVYDGRLTIETIRRAWQLDADLVVLSADRTALGRAAGGDGLLGFTQAFLTCGARAVVASRWKVEDTATALLMVRFYENLLGKRTELKQPLGRAEALAEAKRWLSGLSRQEAGKRLATLAGAAKHPAGKGPEVKLPEGDRPFRHPYYWAAFVLVGDPS